MQIVGYPCNLLGLFADLGGGDSLGAPGGRDDAEAAGADAHDQDDDDDVQHDGAHLVVTSKEEVFFLPFLPKFRFLFSHLPDWKSSQVVGQGWTFKMRL